MSYEKNIQDKVSDGNDLPEKVNLSMIKYFWQSNPFTGKKPDTIPKFLRNIDVLKNFTDNELRILCKSLHHRTFGNREVVFRQGDLGVGFYFLYSGYVDVIVENEQSHKESDEEKPKSNYILSLEKADYFGELALLQDSSVRNATVVAREGCELLGIFKPDVEELINNHPVVATKLLQAVSIIISNRLFGLTKEVRELKFKLSQYERENES